LYFDVSLVIVRSVVSGPSPLSSPLRLFPCIFAASCCCEFSGRAPPPHWSPPFARDRRAATCETGQGAATKDKRLGFWSYRPQKTQGRG
jgi:hypothetical protein